MDDEDVLEPDPAPAGLVDRGLEREDHPFLEALGAIRGDSRLLRPGGSDSVSCVVYVRRPVLGEQLANLAVDVACDDAGPAELDAVVERATDSVEALTCHAVRRADE